MSEEFHLTRISFGMQVAFQKSTSMRSVLKVFANDAKSAKECIVETFISVKPM